MPEPSSPKWPRYGCKFCHSSYVSRALLNRHQDLYLVEYTEAFDIKSVKSTLLKCHPLPVLRAIRSMSERHPGIDRDESRIIQWKDLTFTPFDKDLDLAVKLYNTEAVDIYERRALMSATQWIAQLGYVHSPKRALATKTPVQLDLATPGDDQTASDDDEPDTDLDHDASDTISKAQGRNKFGGLSRRLFSNVGANQQLALGTSSQKLTANDTVSINCNANNTIDLLTPPRKTGEQTVEPRRRKTTARTLFQDSDSEPDAEYGADWDTPTTKGRKGKGKAAPQFMESVVVRSKATASRAPVQNHIENQHDNGQSNPASVRNIEQEPISSTPDANVQDADEGIGAANGDRSNDDAIIDFPSAAVKSKHDSRIFSPPIGGAPSKRQRTMSVPPEPLIPSYISRAGARLAKPCVTPRTRSAQFFTPGNDVPVVLWLNIMLYPGSPKICMPVSLGCTRTTAIQQVRQKLREGGVGEGWPELVGLELMTNPGAALSDANWAELVAKGGCANVGLVWRV